MNTPLTTEEFEALKHWADFHGRTWKSKLRDAWMDGCYFPNTHDSCLQRIRNSLNRGPSWLISFRFPKSA